MVNEMTPKGFRNRFGRKTGTLAPTFPDIEMKKPLLPTCAGFLRPAASGRVFSCSSGMDCGYGGGPL